MNLLLAAIVSQAVGNLFYPGEPVTIQVDGPWAVTDYFGQSVASGTGSLPNLPPGWYELTAASGEQTSFAIVEATPLSVSAPFGTHTHFAQFHNLDIIPVLGKAGISQIRDEQYWSHIEMQPNNYTLPTKFQNYMDLAAQNGINPLICLSFSNQFYDYEEGDFTLPHSPSGRLGYVNYVRFLLGHYGQQMKAVEVWNEVNAGTFIRGPALADKDWFYTELLKSVYPAVKAVRPDVTVVAGATVPTAHGFFRDIFADGALNYMDAASIHPYGSNETIPLEIEDLRALMGSQQKPIWVTEFGVDEGRVESAVDLAQTVVMMLSAGVERIYYYLAQDDGNFPTRGLMADSGDNHRPHQSLVTYSTLIHQLSGAIANGRFATLPSTYAMRFQRGGEQVTALWSNFPVAVRLASASTLQVANVVGRKISLSPIGGFVTLTLSRDVQYVVGPVASVAEVNPSVIADSQSGISKFQGGNGWFYGYGNSGSFTPMEWKIWGTDNYRWIGIADNFGDGVFLHPSGGAWSIRRWVSDRSATARLSGKLSRGGGGNGTQLRILVNGAEVYNTHVAPEESKTYSVEGIQIEPGTQIDFAIDALGDSSFDATGMTSVVEQVSQTPLPPTNLRVQ